jgi:putative ABC transport system ATP-binding protein
MTAAATPEVVVEVQSLRFAWSAAAPLVLDIDSLRVARGERVFLRGASGSGKSTLLSLLAGVVTPREGKIRVLGQELGALTGAQRDHFRADHIGFIFQLFNLIPYLSVIENVTLPCVFSRRRNARASASAGVEREAVRLLEHLDMAGAHVLRRPVTELSVGQQQRVAAARALIGTPELVIADEPTSSLDADRRAAFLDLLFRECVRERTTLIFVSHDASLADRFDRTIELADINRARAGSAAVAA